MSSFLRFLNPALTVADNSTFDSALDFTLLDPHWGTLDEWAKAIDKIHERGMCTFNASSVSLREGRKEEADFDQLCPLLSDLILDFVSCSVRIRSYPSFAENLVHSCQTISTMGNLLYFEGFVCCSPFVLC